MTHLTAVDTFRTTVNAHIVAPVQGLFVPDNTGSPPYPNVGLTTGVGPQFKYQNGIGILFTALFASFPNLVLSYRKQRPTPGRKHYNRRSVTYYRTARGDMGSKRCSRLPAPCTY